MVATDTPAMMSAAPRKAMGVKISPTRKNENTAEQTGSSEKANPVVSAGTCGCT